MTYALILPPEILAELAALRSQYGVSIRKICLDSIWNMIGEATAASEPP